MAATTLITTEQYLAQPGSYDRSGNRIKDELVAGEVRLVAPPSKVHDVVKNRLNLAVAQFLAAQPGLKLEVYCEIAFAVTERDTFVPAVSVIREGRIYESTSRILTGAPELAVEVVSPSDEAEYIKHKISAYLSNGAAGVWVVYPIDRSVQIHSPEGIREATAEQVLESGLLPGFSLRIESLFTGL